MVFAALLLALAAVSQDSDGTLSEQQTTDGGDGGYAQEQGYEEAPAYEAYTAPQAAPHYVPAPPIRRKKICFHPCPADYPCFGGGGCVASTCGSTAAAPVAASYDAQQQTDYRKLQQGYNDDQAQTDAGSDQTYAVPAEPLVAPVAETCGCPVGTVDTSHLVVSNSIILWIAFALLFIPAFIFLCRGVVDVRGVLSGTDLLDYMEILALAFTVTKSEDDSAKVAQAVLNRFDSLLFLPRIFAGVIVTVASLAYLTMATGHGYIIKCNGRAFYYARYIDWVITTPLLLADIVTFSGYNGYLYTYWICSMDILMIVSGLLGELTEGPEKWIFFGVGILFFLPILYWLCRIDVADGRLCGAAAGLNPAEKLFQNVAALTWISWCGYPIVWILSNAGGGTSDNGVSVVYAPATYEEQSYGAPKSYAAQQAGYRHLQSTESFAAPGVLSVTVEVCCYAVLDIISKSLFGFIIVFHGWGTDWSWFFGECSGCSEPSCDTAECCRKRCESDHGVCGWQRDSKEDSNSLTLGPKNSFI